MEESTMLIGLFSHKCKEGTDGGHSQFLKSTIYLPDPLPHRSSVYRALKSSPSVGYIGLALGRCVARVTPGSKAVPSRIQPSGP